MIATFNRPDFIGETLDSICTQLTDECEVVILDAAHCDRTARIVYEKASRTNNIRYIGQPQNNGLDEDYDRAVGLAKGEYCWLMTDDDVFKAGAVATVLSALKTGVSLAIVNVEIRDFTLARVVQRRWLELSSDRVYAAEDLDRLFVDTSTLLKYIGGVIIRRSVWIERLREKYYGSHFLHVGVIFQEPLPKGALLIAEPAIIYRMGNTHSYSPLVAEIVFSRWPLLMQSLAISSSAKRKVASVEPWAHLMELLLWRGLGYYSFAEYRRWIRPRNCTLKDSLMCVAVALTPGVVINIVYIFFYSQIFREHRRLLQLKSSRFYLGNWVFKRR